MLKKMRTLLLLLAVAPLALGRAPAAQPTPTNSTPAVQPSAPSGDPLVAKGKGVEIRRSRLGQSS